MAEASRFPQLALPFAIVGASGGWLSASLVSNPLVQRFYRDLRIPAIVVAAAVCAAAGALLTRWCKHEQYGYDIDAPDPEARAPADTWALQAGVVLAAGAVTGAIVALFCDVYKGPALGALAGVGCAVAFVPVCLAVIAAARRAKRARLGSLVSDSDRRAVWGILATALSVATLEALPAWPASKAGQAPSPVPAVVMLAVSALSIVGILIADIRGLRRAKEALAPGLVERDPTSLGEADNEAPRLDLGLGDDLAARVARAAAAYRGRDRTLALVQGDAGQAMSAFRRALARGGVGLAIVAMVVCAHSAARGDAALAVFDEARCDSFDYKSCGRLADAVRETHPSRAMLLYERACGAESPDSCIALGEMYRDQADDWDSGFWSNRTDAAESHERATNYFSRACRYGDRRGCLFMAR